MAKSKPRKKKGSSSCPSHKDSYIKLAKRLKELCQMVDCNIMQHINTIDQIRDLGHYRVRLGNVTEVRCPFVEDDYKTLYSKRIKTFCKIELINIKGLPQKVSFNDIVILFALQTFLGKATHIDERDRDNSLQQIKVFFPEKDSIFKHLVWTLRHLCLLENLPNEPIVCFNFDFNNYSAAHNKCLGTFDFILIIEAPIIEHVRINGYKRPAFRCFFPIEHSNIKHFSSLPSKSIEQLYKGDGEKLNIYIQSHAIKRFRERLTPIHEIHLRNIFNDFTLNLPQAIIKGRKIFLPLDIGSIKVGYFIAELVDNKVVIKTFILITHASAPEGSQFQALTGFEKHDMSYWNIEKLETFIYNSMEADNPLYPYFEQSKIIHLFDLNDDLTDNGELYKKDAHWDKMARCLDRYNQHGTLTNPELKEVKLEHMLSG